LRGDQLPPDHDPIDVEWLRAASGLELVEVLAEATSTMDRGREIATAVDSPLPAAVIAERQTAGRGRRGASWWQPPGSLAVSLVVDGAAWGGSPRPIWSLACGIALAETIRLLEPSVAAVVRWPNTTGTAAEAPEPLRQRVATLPDLTGRPLARQRLLAVLVPRLLDLLAADAAETAGRYRSLCGLTGKSVRVFVGDAIHEGTCRGVADDGGLVVATAAGEVVIHSGSLTPPGSEWRGGQG